MIIMKKAILSAVILLGGMSMQARSTSTIVSPLVASVQTQDEYKEINAVPVAIKTALDQAYPGVELEKAYVNEKKEYKIEIIVRKVKSTVYTDAQGKILKK
jgi:carbamate kinase